MTGYEYEKKCAELLKAKGFSDVTVTPGSGDQGIDVLAKKGKKKYGIQCKYYEGTVGNKAVQEAFAGASFYDCSVAMVITNSKLTEPAKKLAAKLGVEFWEGIDAVYLQKNDAEYIKKQAEKKKKDQERRAAAKEEKKQQLAAEFQQWQKDYPKSKAALRKKLEKSDAEYARKRQELDTPISVLKSEKSQLSVKLETMPFFAFAEKHKVGKRLNEIDAEVKELTLSYNKKLII